MGAKGRRTTNRRKVKTRKSWRNPYWRRPSKFDWDGPARLRVRSRMLRLIKAAVATAATITKLKVTMTAAGTKADEAADKLRGFGAAMRRARHGKT